MDYINWEKYIDQKLKIVKFLIELNFGGIYILVFNKFK